MTDLEDFMEQLSSAAPVPGGGSVAALESAMGAALLAMVANLTIGRRRYIEVTSQAIGIRNEALDLSRRATRLADDDSAAYGRVSRALQLPKETDVQKAVRREQVQTALKGAVDPPLETMKAASRVLDLAIELMTIGNKSAISDVGTAAGAARSGFEAALLNVEINLASIDDEAWVRDVRSTLDQFPPVAPRSERVTRHVLSAIRG